MIRVSAPAKVNLFLGVGGLRPDGFHDVTTVLHTLDFADEIEIAPADELVLHCEPCVGVPVSENLAHRAANALAQELGREPRVGITLRKRVPAGAGLAGGSSDAAAVIAGLAELWGVDRTDPACLRAAASVGADVPFFLTRSGAALMTGRGDVFERELPSLPGVPVALVRPPDPVSTLAAYRVFDTSPVDPGSPAAVIDALEAGDATALAAALHNNFEEASAKVVPHVGDALAWVKRADGVLGAAVAGSGSAVFAIVRQPSHAETIAASAADHGWWGLATRLGSAGAVVTTGELG